ncbi:DUF5777 family beta-barrel protein [Yeosuana sp.]|uniref:DUF5777 family beta-barrel protein n=1 Tax=Yeosuana sp. TaxID=2529388 RepID=UPI00405530C8
MKNLKITAIALFILPLLGLSQEKEKDSINNIPERAAFSNSTLIETQTNVLNPKKTLEFVFQHRFGFLNTNKNDMAGFWGPANIRIAIDYALTDRLTVGYGTTKLDRLQDFNLKYGLLTQTRSNSMPISVTYYGNLTMDARSKEYFTASRERYSYFNQLIIAKRFSQNFSLLVAPSLSHYNLVEQNMENNVFSVALGGRLKISPQTAIIVDYSQPLTKYDNTNPLPGISLGAEIATSGHIFQLFMTNYNGLNQQKNYMFNQNDFFNGDFMIGFNITRKYNF